MGKVRASLRDKLDPWKPSHWPLLTSDWPMLITWPEYRPLIGQPGVWLIRYSHCRSSSKWIRTGILSRVETIIMWSPMYFVLIWFHHPLFCTCILCSDSPCFTDHHNANKVASVLHALTFVSPQPCYQWQALLLRGGLEDLPQWLGGQTWTM